MPFNKDYFFYQDLPSKKINLFPITVTIPVSTDPSDQLYLFTINNGSLVFNPLSSFTSTTPLSSLSSTSFSWDSIYNKPNTYPPSSHTHNVSDFIDLYNFHWNNVINKPTTFPPQPHTHILTETLSPLPPGPVNLSQIKDISATATFLALTSTEEKRNYLEFYHYDTTINNTSIQVEVRNNTTGTTYFSQTKKILDLRLCDPLFKVTGSASTNTFTISSTHNFYAGDLIWFYTKNGANNISLSSNYYVVEPVTVTDFKVSTTPYGAPISLGTDMVSGTVQRKKTNNEEENSYFYLDIHSSTVEPEYEELTHELELKIYGGSWKTRDLTFTALAEPIIPVSRIIIKNLGDLSLLQQLYFTNIGRIFTFYGSKKLRSLQKLSFELCGKIYFMLKSCPEQMKIKDLRFQFCGSFYSPSYYNYFEITDARWFKDLEFIIFNDCGSYITKIIDQSYTLPESKVKLLLEALNMPNSLNGTIKILKLKTTGTSTLTSLINSLQSNGWQIDLLVE